MGSEMCIRDRHKDANQKISVNIYTFGLKYAKASYGDDLIESTIRNGKDVLDSWRRGNVCDPSANVIAFDCQIFPTKGLSGTGLRNHVGTHPGHLAQLNSIASESALQKCVQSCFYALSHCTSDKLEVLLYGSSGRYANVSMSLVLQTLLRRTSCVLGVAVTHLSEPVWHASPRFCSRCEECCQYIYIYPGPAGFQNMCALADKCYSKGWTRKCSIPPTLVAVRRSSTTM